MSWITTIIGVLAAAAAARYAWRRYGGRDAARPSIDDTAIERIITEGRLSAPDPDPPLDLQAAAEAEEEFWSQSWDEPDEYRS